MSSIDKIIRIVLGVAILIYFGLFYPTWWAFLGLIPLVTGVSEFCPIYKIIKKENKKTSDDEKKIPKKRKFLKQKNLDTDESLFKD